MKTSLVCLFVCSRGHLTDMLPGSKWGSYPISYRVSVTRLSVCILFQNDLSAISSRFKIDLYSYLESMHLEALSSICRSHMARARLCFLKQMLPLQNVIDGSAGSFLEQDPVQSIWARWLLRIPCPELGWLIHHALNITLASLVKKIFGA